MMFRSPESYLSSINKVQIYNTLSGRKDEFLPLDKHSATPEVKMYVCGLTPYDHAHLGHAVRAIRFDYVIRYLEYRNLKVTYVENVTDIDDKIINRARETGADARELGQRFTNEYYDLSKRLGLRLPDRIPYVTGSIADIQIFIQKLIDNGIAYVTADGNVYYEISKKADYGKLSRQNTAQLLEEVRKEADEQKRSPLDFALWKRDDESTLSTDSPWGKGRPGWHIECSAMCHTCFGPEIDIHGGGLDLKFPHHENEIAQSEAHSGGTFSRFWMHCGLLTLDGVKMSKSLGNTCTMQAAYEKYGSELLRFVFLRNHYRSNVDLSDKLFRDNLNALLDFYRTLDEVRKISDLEKLEVPPQGAAAQSLRRKFEEAMDNDFNTPLALVALTEALADLKKLLGASDRENKKVEIVSLGSTISAYGSVFGLFGYSTQEVVDQLLSLSASLSGVKKLSESDIQALLEKRITARKNKDFAQADAVRKDLATAGLDVLDSKTGGSSWIFATVSA